MAAKPVASAVAGSAFLSELSTGLKRAGLIDSLNTAKALTLFAPVNSAIRKSKEWASAKSRDELARLLANHVLPERLSPQHVLGRHTSIAGATVAVEMDAGQTKVNGAARVICANIQTRNATIYLIDTLLSADGFPSSGPIVTPK
ncbi:fasciclin domain-containing protein [Actinoplanes aureus]|uniref:Fasciclin domain-containing protein n=1 Tax=Actinoplanes aureus TaxID=2792083 RepID=A0A931CMU2_9ACTN|nr:fasciclin domain-containing protein [Actinoplanes aureus]MBG0569238.1 fasciclin domain-containing protein [Actinoplanes aureus]